MDNIEILVADDEQEMLVNYQRVLKRAGYNIQTAKNAEEVLNKLQSDQVYSLVISDLKMPGMNGMSLLTVLKEKYPHLPVIMVTGYGTLEIGIEAVKSGAFDFIEKPFSNKKLLNSVENALKEIRPPEPAQFGENIFDNIVGRSAPMLQIFEMIKKISYGNGNVLITGESGVGKELVARSIHKNSLRRNNPLIPINCGALPDQLFESELFGYEKGAFTGAFQSKPGLVELANGGTLFLDEICELPHNLQVKLLRMLEERNIRRIGGQKEIQVNIRVVCATNRNVEDAIKIGRLREDFFYRINTIQVQIPPLRKRKDDIPLLLKYFLEELERKYERNIHEIEDKAMEVCLNYDWPGNVRELQNITERAFYLATPSSIRINDLPSYLKSGLVDEQKQDWENLSYKEAKQAILDNFEREYLKLQLKKYDWNISKTADACDIDRRTIHRLINKYKLKFD